MVIPLKHKIMNIDCKLNYRNSSKKYVGWKSIPELSKPSDFLDDKSQLKIIKYGSCILSEIMFANSPLRLQWSKKRALDSKLEDLGLR